MKTRLSRFLGLALVFGMAFTVFAEDDNVPKDNLKLKKAPAFKLKDQSGKEQSLEGLLKKKNVALVFYRSASW